MSDLVAQRSRARREAASWFARRSRLSVTTDELHEFRDWKRQNGNAEAYAQVEATWAAAGSLAEDSDIQAATARTLADRPARARRAFASSVLPGGALLALISVVVVGGGGLLALNRLATTFGTAIGEQSQVTLDDGSRVHLNTDSKIIVRFHRRERDIELVRGEAFFEVAHDTNRPFIVQADGARVRAVGTKFDVKRDPDGVHVTLLEGRVRVAKVDSNASTTLDPNQQLTVTERGLSAPKPTDAALQSGWTSGRLTFHALPLAAAVAEVNRYTAHKVMLDLPAAAAQQPVTGVFDAGDTDAFVSSVAAALDLKATKTPDGSTRLVPGSEAPAA